MSSLQLYKKKERKTKKLPEFYLPTKKRKKLKYLRKVMRCRATSPSRPTNDRPTQVVC